MRARLMVLFSLFCLISMNGCGNSNGTSNTESETNNAYSVRFLTQPPTTLTSRDFDVQIEVVDEFGDRVTSDQNLITIGIDTNPGGGTLTGRLERYPSSGVATFSGLQIDRAGQGYRLFVESSGTYSAVSNAFDVQEQGGTGPGPGNRLVLQGVPANAVAGVPLSPLNVSLRDANNNLVTNISQDVTLQVSSGNVVGNTVATLTNGVASFGNLTFTRAGALNLTVSSFNLNNVTSSNFVVAPGPARAVRFFTQPLGGVTGGPLVPTAQAEMTDSLGNRVTTASNVISLSGQGGAGLLSGLLTRAATQGLATFPGLSISLDGTYQVVANAGPVQAISTPFSVSTANGTVLLFQQAVPSSLKLGVPLRVVAALTDAQGNLQTQVGGIAVTLSILPGQDSVEGASLDAQGNHVLQQNGAGGTATFNNLFLDKVGGYNVTLSAPGVFPVTTSLNVTP